jgi:hypothetical protein
MEEEKSGKIDPGMNQSLRTSNLPEPLELNPQLIHEGIDPYAKNQMEADLFTTEEELYSRVERDAARQEEVEGNARREADWGVMGDAEIFLHELEKLRPGTRAASDFLFHERQGGFEVHLFGRRDKISRAQVKYARDNRTWHLMARGALDRLRKPSIIAAPPRYTETDIYRDQLYMLEELIGRAGLESEELGELFEGLVEEKDEAVRYVTGVNRLLDYIVKKTEELRCRTEVKAEGAERNRLKADRSEPYQVESPLQMQAEQSLRGLPRGPASQGAEVPELQKRRRALPPKAKRRGRPPKKKR